MKPDVGINRAISPDMRSKVIRDRLEQRLEVPLITRVEHPCRVRDCETKIIPVHSPAYLSEVRTDFEMVGDRARRLEEPLVAREYRHYPNCKDPIVASEQLDLPFED